MKQPNTVIHIGTVNLHVPSPGVLLQSGALKSAEFAERMAVSPGQVVDIPHKTVFDARTGLMWSKGTIAKGKTWAEAKEAAAAVTLGGYTDWRLPTRAELLTLVDDTRSKPAIDTSKFDCDSDWYWSSTPLASSPSVYAWGVSFSLGLPGCSNQDSSGRVRAVRSVAPSASGQ